MARRTQKEAEKTRRIILDAATNLFESKGYSNTTIAEIVDATHLTKGAVFHHFTSKEALFTEIWTGLQTDMDAVARAAAAEQFTNPDPYAAFLAGSRIYLDWVARRDYRQIVLIDGPAVLGISGWYERDSELGRDNVRSGIRYLIKCGIVADDREADLSVLFQSILNAAGYALAREEPGVTADSLFDAFEMLLRNAR
jgi:AcrR family transcriptional regulator